jgi:hypothetical protein
MRRSYHRGARNAAHKNTAGRRRRRIRPASRLPAEPGGSCNSQVGGAAHRRVRSKRGVTVWNRTSDPIDRRHARDHPATHRPRRRAPETRPHRRRDAVPSPPTSDRPSSLPRRGGAQRASGMDSETSGCCPISRGLGICAHAATPARVATRFPPMGRSPAKRQASLVRDNQYECVAGVGYDSALS